MDLESLDSNENDYIDKKLMKVVNKSLSMFSASGSNRGIKLPKLLKTGKAKDGGLESVSDMLTNLLGKDLGEKEQLEFKIGLMELIDNVESKYVESATTRGIINKVLFMLLMKVKFK